MRVLLSVVVALLFVLPQAIHCETQSIINWPYGLGYLNAAPSPRAIGMGEASVTLVDPYSAWANPASPALMGGEDRLWLTGWPGTAGLYSHVPYYWHIPSVGHVSVTVPLYTQTEADRVRRRLVIGYYHTWTRTPEFEYLINWQLDSTIIVRNTSHSHNLVLAAVLSGRFDIALGGTIRYFRESALGVSGDQIGADVGLLIRAPLDRLFHGDQLHHGSYWSFTPALGVAVKNFGRAFDFEGGERNLWQPRTLHVGVSTEVAFGSRERAIFSIIPAFECKHEVREFEEYLLGVETGLYDAVYVRAGWKPIRHRDDQKTFGFALHSRGIVRLIWPDKKSDRGLRSLLRDRMDIEFSYASHLDDDVYFGNIDRNIDRYGLSLTLR